MPIKIKTTHPPRQMFLLDKAKSRPSRFSGLQPHVVNSLGGVRDSVGLATKDTLWVSYEKDLTEALLRIVFGPPRSLGKAVLMHAVDPQAIPALNSCFKRFAFASNDGFLPPEELAEVLEADNAADLFIGGSLDPASHTITLWRGNLEPLTIPFSTFETSGEGIAPDFDRFSVIDCGQTVRLGNYEAASDAILYEFDPGYRRRISKERRASDQSFGASLRRLRKQRGLRREDFEPQLSAKTIARIEQGKVESLHRKTLQAIAHKLEVKPEDIRTF